MEFTLTEVLLLLGGVGVIIAVIARKWGVGQGWKEGYKDREDDE